MKPGGDLYDAKFTVLGEYVNPHVKEEQQGRSSGRRDRQPDWPEARQPLKPPRFKASLERWTV